MRGMDQIPLGDSLFFFFVIPGFIMVWTFRYLSKSKKTGDFELLGLSVFWGLMSLIFFELYVHVDCAFGVWWGCSSGDPQKAIQQILSNPFGFAAVFSVPGVMFGWMGHRLASSFAGKWLIRKARGEHNKVID
jgi:hypothetical protein